MSEGPTFLTDKELSKIAGGLTQPAAIIRELRRQGYIVGVAHNGKPYVDREHYKSRMNGTPAKPMINEPNFQAMYG